VRDAIPLGRIAGFPVKVHWSVIVILWLFTWSLATTLPGAVAGYSRPVYWLAGACGALVLLASLLAHELAHAVVARRMGVSVGDVTLWLFGGVTTLQGEAKTPKAAFRIAFAGPATSLVLSAVFAGLAIALSTVRCPLQSVLLGGWPPSTYCWACSTCCPVPRWTVGGWCARIYGTVTAIACAPQSVRRMPDKWSPSS
jgi:Zn-dependent protease